MKDATAVFGLEGGMAAEGSEAVGGGRVLNTAVTRHLLLVDVELFQHLSQRLWCHVEGVVWLI